MSKRRWISAEKREPPVSTKESRFWLELYLPERVEASPIKDAARGYATGVYMGSGTYRLAGAQSATTEFVKAWRPLAGEARPVSGTVKVQKTSSQVLKEAAPNA